MVEKQSKNTLKKHSYLSGL